MLLKERCDFLCSIHATMRRLTGESVGSEQFSPPWMLFTRTTCLTAPHRMDSNTPELARRTALDTARRRVESRLCALGPGFGRARVEDAERIDLRSCACRRTPPHACGTQSRADPAAVCGGRRYGVKTERCGQLWPESIRLLSSHYPKLWLISREFADHIGAGRPFLYTNLDVVIVGDVPRMMTPQDDNCFRANYEVAEQAPDYRLASRWRRRFVRRKVAAL